MSTATPTIAPTEVDRPSDEDVVQPARVWVVIVWNDPINLMSYVTYVFQKLFGYSRDKATKLMLDVHQKGKAVVSSGTREKAEFDVSRLHAHGLWATMQRD
jgi:ATP-dependent Clp protease adaptor protein ClpS